MAEDCRNQTRCTRQPYALARCRLLGLFIVLSVLMTSMASAQSVRFGETDNLAQILLPKWQRFSQDAAHRATTVVTQQTLNQFPQGLLLSSSRYPMMPEYDWPTLRALYRFSRDCPPLAAVSLAALPVGLDKAYRFEAALCNGQPLSAVQQRYFLTQTPLRYPAGGSYADRYLRWLQAQGLSAPAATLRAEYAHWLSVEDSAHPLHRELAALAPAQRDQLLSGDSWVLDSRQRVWLSGPVGLGRLELAQWQALARQAGITLMARDTVTVCPLPVGALCVLPAPAWFTRSSLVWGALVLCALWVLRLLWLRRRAALERRFVLQLLTHELRTPVASLSLALEMLRAEYATLSPAGQLALTRVLGDGARLTRLTRTSREFLSLSGRARWPTQTVMLDEWLEGVTEKYTDLLIFDFALTAIESEPVTVPTYWLGLCLDNLIRNALQHGCAPITLRVQLSAKNLYLTVEDSGEGPSGAIARRWPWWGGACTSDMGVLARTSSSQEAGMGIGLFLVRRMMQRAGGRLRVQRRPTRYTLELPR